MTSLFYKIIGNYGEFRKSSGSGADRVRIHIDGADGGIVGIGSLFAPLKGGAASLSLSKLKDGIYTPSLYLGGRLIRLEAVEKHGDSLKPCAFDPAMLRALALRTEALEERVKLLEEDSRRHEAAICGSSLFGE